MSFLYELEPRKKVFGDRWAKSNIDFQQLQDFYLLEKYDDLPESVSFSPKV